ncbi:MAG: magnesium transporter [Bacilli bacterium]|nr:magnesium transporter [Bacilli bacterium]
MDEEREEEREGLNVAKVESEQLQDIIDRKDRGALKDIFLHVPAIDIAEAADEMEAKDLIFIFRNVESSLTADFFDALSQDTKEQLIAAMTNRDLVQIINSQAADDVADTVGDMPANLANKVLRAADKDMRKDINQLLKYEEGTAGSIMTTEYLEFGDSLTVEQAIEQIRERGRDAETIYTIFVRDPSRRFVGTVDLDDLIFASKQQKLSEIMNQDVVSCFVGTDQEEIGQLFRRYDLNALAVLNDDSCLVGIVTIDDAVDVMTEESNEDLARMTNMEPIDEPYMELSAWSNAKRCIPWLIALLILGTFTTMVLNRLESQDVFVRLPILIAFVPMLMDTGGNAGGQTTGMMIRGLAVKEFGPKQVLSILFREFKSALIVAGTVASFVFVWLLIEQYTGIVNGVGPGLEGMNVWNGQCWTAEFAGYALRNAGLVALTMMFAIIVSKAVGTLLPMGAAAIKKDPALLSQPLLTTVMDVATLMIYFAIAMTFHP